MSKRWVGAGGFAHTFDRIGGERGVVDGSSAIVSVTDPGSPYLSTITPDTMTRIAG
jgi:hypothetical protein